ncbi:hypothetical protein [Streptomyces sennicomposti]|uniref:hypothetical protein n=1 Tax=Streptomyces sennicomposti TaxID=2873384 RepID=UPI001CA65235|nr:hypothetical protein [Streptomyces sennicomposti]MBY8869968.1 hypothetical protein [Streptomyces sennicomposti]
MTDPLSRTILLLDIEKYSDRDDVAQAMLRRKLYDIADRTLEAAGIAETLRSRADRGDSVMELIDAGASVRSLLRALLTEVPAQLHAYNRMASSTAQIRLRGVVAGGYVAVDEHGGWVGSDLNHACRLLDAQLLREALRSRPDGFALCVSEGVHAGIVRHDHPGVPAADFRPVTLDSKNGPLRAWLHGPVPDGDDHCGTGAGETPVPGASGDGPAPGSRPRTETAAGTTATTADGTAAGGTTATADGSAADGRADADAAGPVRQGTTASAQTAQAAQPAQPAQTVPGGAAPGGHAPAGPVFHFTGGAPRFGGSLVAGDQHGVSGGQVTGDVRLGGSAGEDA